MSLQERFCQLFAQPSRKFTQPKQRPTGTSFWAWLFLMLKLATVACPYKSTVLPSLSRVPVMGLRSFGVPNHSVLQKYWPLSRKKGREGGRVGGKEKEAGGKEKGAGRKERVNKDPLPHPFACFCFWDAVRGDGLVGLDSILRANFFLLILCFSVSPCGYLSKALLRPPLGNQSQV